MAQFEIYVGIDWSTQTHQVAADGELLGERAFAHNGDGIMFQKFCKMLSLKFGHGMSLVSLSTIPCRKGRHHDRDA